LTNRTAFEEKRLQSAGRKKEPQEFRSCRMDDDEERTELAGFDRGFPGRGDRDDLEERSKGSKPEFNLDTTALRVV
jgi:hypothetical protein